MTFIKHSQTAIRIKRLTINLEYFNDDLDGVLTESKDGSVSVIFEGSDGKDIVKRKKLMQFLSTVEKAGVSSLIDKLVTKAEKAIE